ncbi:MAG: hypothetical protein FWD48_09920 [Oscillospiraceae bacterium]|nr:hypothetical protein [Oscillospiraceae bacterium]
MSVHERKRKHVWLDKTIRIKMIQWNYDKKQLAALLHLSLASLYNRLNNPDSFTYKELQALFHYLKFTPEEQAQAI